MREAGPGLRRLLIDPKRPSLHDLASTLSTSRRERHLLDLAPDYVAQGLFRRLPVDPLV